MEEEDFDSDTSDEDYVPTGGAVSDGDLSGSDAEEEDEDTEDPEEHDGKLKGSKKRKRGAGAKQKKGKRKTKKKLDSEPEPEPPAPEQNEEDKTKRADSLWADFMKDVGGVTPSAKSAAVSAAVKGDTQAKPSQPSPKPVEAKPEKVVITKVYEFAGEEVRVTKEVEANSDEAKKALTAPSPLVLVTAASSSAAAPSSSASPAGVGGQKRPLVAARGGLASLASVLGAKRDKISTLEKSKLDWDNFKKAENIEEELKVFNQGKSGYLERQAFLERTDLKQFEIERNLRLNRRSNR